MVKSKPRIPNREQRKKKRFETKYKQTNQIINTQETLNPSPPSTNPLKRRSPSSTSVSLKPAFNFRESRCSMTQFISGYHSFSDPRKPECPILPSVARNVVGQLPPLPPQPSHLLLRRTVSDPVPFGSYTPPPKSGFSEDAKNGSGSGGERSSSSKRLKRMSKKISESNENSNGLVSKPTNTCICCSKNEEKKEMRERAVRAERLGGDWIMIIINCPCGSDYQFMVSEAEKKCYYKLM